MALIAAVMGMARISPMPPHNIPQNINAIVTTSGFKCTRAPTMVGYAYADYGLNSTVLYLAIGGAALGLMRRYMAGARAPFIARLTYASYALLGGVSSEVGFLSAFYVLGLILPVMAITQVVLMFFSGNPRESPIVRRGQPIPARALTR